MEKISETLNTAITDDTKSSPTPAEKANAITGCQTTAAQLRHIAANIAKH